MDDPVGFACGDGNQLQQAAGAICADHQHAVLAAVLVLDDPDRVLVGVEDVGFLDSVLPSRLSDPACKDYLYMRFS